MTARIYQFKKGDVVVFTDDEERSGQLPMVIVDRQSTTPIPFYFVKRFQTIQEDQIRLATPEEIEDPQTSWKECDKIKC